MTAKDEQIKINLEGLDIKMIHNILTQNNIKWVDSESGEKRIPTIKEIKAVAEHCMREAFKSERKSFSMGGFESEVIDGIVEIRFVISKANPLSKLLG
ncbi:MAG: hypothetical protein AABY15_01745 [Nanoarchaeota archaeon]